MLLRILSNEILVGIGDAGIPTQKTHVIVRAAANVLAVSRRGSIRWAAYRYKKEHSVAFKM